MADYNEQSIKFGFLTVEQMLSAINSHQLQTYNICFTKDTHQIFVIKENLEPLEIHSRVYVFDSITEAETKLNESTDTYVGQVVAILDNDTYRGYIVNQKNGKFIVTPLWEHSEPIDYDTLGNRPIVNLVGTLDEPIMVSELDDGIYRIKGQYKISDLEKTIYLSASDILMTVSKNNQNIEIKKITSDNITDYIITNSDISKNTYVTEQYLKDNNYTTTSYVDTKIEALEVSIKEDMRGYVQEAITEVFGEELDKRIDDRIDEKIVPMSDSQIRNLF